MYGILDQGALKISESRESIQKGFRNVCSCPFNSEKCV